MCGDDSINDRMCENASMNEKKSEKQNARKSDDAVEKKPVEHPENRVFVNVTHLQPGAILRGKTFTDAGEPLYEEYHAFSESEIAKLQERKIEKIYYVPVTGNVSVRAVKEGYDFMVKLLNVLRSGKNIDVAHLKKVVNIIMDDIYPQDVGLLTLLTLKEYNEYAYVHSVNVGIISMLLAKKTGMKENEVREVGMGAFLHDVGKINIPSEMIWKMDGSTEEEKKVIREHPIFGHSILKSSGGVPEGALEIVLRHHEHFNGSGYPSGVDDKSLSPGVRVVSICNHYDFQITAGEGKAPVMPREALFRIQKLAGTVFNPIIVHSFLREMTRHVMDGPMYPVGSVVLLTSKEIAVVREIRKESDFQPLVDIISDIHGRKLQRPIRVDLRNDETRKIQQIVSQAK